MTVFTASIPAITGTIGRSTRLIEGETWSYPEFIPGTTSSTGSGLLDMVTGDTGRIYLVYIRKTDSSLLTGSIYFMRSQ